MGFNLNNVFFYLSIIYVYEKLKIKMYVVCWHGDFILRWILTIVFDDI